MHGKKSIGKRHFPVRDLKQKQTNKKHTPKKKEGGGTHRLWNKTHFVFIYCHSYCFRQKSCGGRSTERFQGVNATANLQTNLSDNNKELWHSKGKEHGGPRLANR